MTDQDSPGPGLPDDPDAALAAEFVLRLLDPSEEAACAAREARDPAFAALVARWRVDLSGFDADFAAAAPPPGLQRRIEARLFGAAPSPLARLWNSAGLWRLVAAAALAAAGYFATLHPAPPPGAPHLVASIAPSGSDVGLLAYIEPQAAALTINRVSGEARPGRALELWAVFPGEAPVSLGVLPAAARARVALPPALAARIGPDTTLAVSDEPPGGSPNGKPTAVVAAGKVSEI